MLENMKAFRMVVECQGFRAAAMAMKLSPAMISRRIERLESEVNAQLIKRNSRRISLTTAGEQFYQRCLLIIDEYESCLRDVKSLSNEIGGNLKVGIPHSISNQHVIPHLGAFLARYPNLKLDIVTGNHCMELFSHGFDLALQCGPLPDSNLYYTLIGYWRKYTCLSRSYAQQHGIPQHPDELRQHTCLLHFDNHRRSWKFIIDDELVEIRPHYVSRVSNSLDLCNMVHHGLGICYLPEFTVRAGMESGEIITALDAYMPAPLPMYVVHINPHPSPKEQAFIDFLRTLNLATAPVPAS
ncbi:LysR family transcriptional regulator [Enterobacter chuandaensis]|uniref:LysR family transcriptional regulator n=1 Tax=Enterobacter chuandaensis TaxID=2497875 RepID=UPI00300C7B8E